MARTPPKPEEIYEIFLDESSQNNHQYLVLGSVVVPLTNSAALTQALSNAKLPDFATDSELKWVKVSKLKLDAYKRFVDVFFDRPKGVHFHSLFVDTHKLNHAKFNEGDREIGFNKEIYQLAMKSARLYRNKLFHVYPDRRDTTQLPVDLRMILNAGCRKRGDKRDWPFRRCQFRDSRENLILQLTDILTGALAFHLNGHAKVEGASPAKIALAKHILERASVVDVFQGTGISGSFTVWPRRLNK